MLNILLLIPIISIILLYLPLGNKGDLYFQYTSKNFYYKFIGISGSIISLLYIVYIYIFYFDNNNIDFQFITSYTWFNSSIYFGLDGVSLLFILLTAILIPMCIFTCEFNFIKNNNDLRTFIVILLIIEFLLFGLFSTLNLLVFYLFYESLLIPMFLMIGLWGYNSRKIRAAYLFFFYTLIGSLLFLISIIYIYNIVGDLDIRVIKLFSFNTTNSKWLWLAFFFAFAVKIPMPPFHIWLPEAHVEAPAPGSILLAGILLKMGGYGFFRFCISFFYEAYYYFSPMVYVLAIVGICYISLVACIQNDIKRIIAYSSIAHMNYVMIALTTMSNIGIFSAMQLMISHGIVSGGLFLLVGMLYERYHTRILYYYGGLSKILPLFSLFFYLLSFANIAVPGTSSFIGEFFVLYSIFSENTFVGLLASTAVVLSSAYSLLLLNRVFSGSLKMVYINSDRTLDISHLEFVLVFVLAFLIILLGVYPNTLLLKLELSNYSFLLDRF